jgi:hypothetical protein
MEIFDQSNQRISFAKYEYDLNALKPLSGAAPTNFCTDSYCASVTQRGNLSKLTAYENAADLTGIVFDNRIYDKTGNMVTYASENTGTVQKAYTYTPLTAYAYPEEVLIGDVYNVNAPDLKVKSSAIYDFNTGLTLSVRDSDQQLAQLSFDLQTWRPTRITSAAGAYVTFDFDDLNRAYTQIESDANGQAKAKQISRLNRLGLPYRQETLTDLNGQNQEIWNVVESEYDYFGRLRKTSNPFRRDASQHGIYFSEIFYDTRGRVWKTTTPDGSSALDYYNEATRPQGVSSEAGRTFRMVEPSGRQKWYRTDADENITEVMEPDPNDDGSVATGGLLTKYYYARLGQLLRTEQGAQQRFFRYDSLGRLTQQKGSEAQATLGADGTFLGAGNGQWSDVYAYDKLGNITSHTDARGVKTNYSYINPAFPQLPIDPLNRLFSVSYNANEATDVLASPTVYCPNTLVQNYAL